MSRYHYQSYEPSASTRRYGELIPSGYIPPLDKFQGTTTTSETYQGHSGTSLLIKQIRKNLLI